MSIVTMNMSSYEIEKDDSITSAEEMVQSSGWTPALAMQPVAEVRRAPSMPPSLAGADVEGFLDRMYAWQR